MMWLLFKQGDSRGTFDLDGCGYAGSSDALLKSHFHHIYMCGVTYRYMEFDVLPSRTIGVFQRDVFSKKFSQRGAKFD